MPTVPSGSKLEQDLLALAAQRGAKVVGGPPIEPPRAEPVPVFRDEADFQAAIIDQAKKWGWKLIYHTYDSRRCPPGFPDLQMIRRNRLLVAELKRSRKEKPTAAQREWLRGFQGIAGAEVWVWSPEDWDLILRTLS